MARAPARLFFLAAGQNMSTAPPLASGMILGGVLISALGAGSTVFIEEKNPTVKSLSRDFIIGAVMLALLMQLLPESTTSLIALLLGLVPTSLLSSVSDAAESIGSVAMRGAAVAEEEVKVGVPRF